MEKIYANKFEYLQEMNKSFQRYKLPALDQEQKTEQPVSPERN